MKGMDKTISLILAKVKPPKGKGIAVGMGGPMGHEEEPSDDLEMIAEELIAAVKEGNTKGVVEALRGAFLTLDSEPHVEGEHLDEESEEEEEYEQEGPEHEASESAGEEAGEKYGRKEDLFKKYFGGGSARYAEGGTVPKKKTAQDYDDDILAPGRPGQDLLKSYTSGSPGVYDKIKADPIAKKVFDKLAANAATDDEITKLRQDVRTPGSGYWFKVEKSKASQGKEDTGTMKRRSLR